MLIVALFLVAATLFFLGVKIGLFDKEAELGEGVFKHTERTWDLGGFVEREVGVFWFDGYCKSCLKKDGQPNFKKGSVYGNCFICVPFRAKNESSFFPQKGDSIRIIGKKRFGKIISYRMEKTDFAERYPDHKRSGEDKYKGAFFNAMNEHRTYTYDDLFADLAKNTRKTPEDLKKALEDAERRPSEITPKCLEEEELNNLGELDQGRWQHISECNYCLFLIAGTDGGINFLAAAKRRGERLGKTAEQFLQELWNTVPSSTSECLLPWEVEEVFRSESGCKVLPPNRLEHVKNCSFCRTLILNSGI